MLILQIIQDWSGPGNKLYFFKSLPLHWCILNVKYMYNPLGVYNIAQRSPVAGILSQGGINLVFGIIGCLSDMHSKRAEIAMFCHRTDTIGGDAPGMHLISDLWPVTAPLLWQFDILYTRAKGYKVQHEWVKDSILKLVNNPLFYWLRAHYKK